VYRISNNDQYNFGEFGFSDANMEKYIYTHTHTHTHTRARARARIYTYIMYIFNLIIYIIYKITKNKDNKKVNI